MNQPEVMVASAAQRFDAEGNLTDDRTRELIGQLLTGVVAWTRRLRGDGA